MQRILLQRSFPIEELRLFASPRSAGKRLEWRNTQIVVEDASTANYNGLDIALFSAGKTTSLALAEKVASEGVLVIDNSSAWRMDPDVPLVVPEVNADAVTTTPKGIIANPNCSTAQLVLALKPLHDVFKVKRVVVSTYQSVSGAGKSGMDELFNQTRAIYVNDPIENTEFTKQIAFNCIPHIDVFMDDGYTKEEWKLAAETRKILDPDISLVAHCVRVPVFIGHAEAVFVETEKPIDEQGARDVLSAFPGVVVVDHRSVGSSRQRVGCECIDQRGSGPARLAFDPGVRALGRVRRWRMRAECDPPL
jgi:aspartate-semialdehyde dehydrogenase